MKLSFEIENVGHSGAESTVKALCAFLNHHVLPSGNKITLKMPPEKFDVSGIYTTRISVEIAEKPTRPLRTGR